MGCASSKGTGGDRAPRIVGKGGAGAGAAGAAGVDAKNLRVKVCIKAARQRKRAAQAAGARSKGAAPCACSPRLAGTLGTRRKRGLRARMKTCVHAGSRRAGRAAPGRRFLAVALPPYLICHT